MFFLVEIHLRQFALDIFNNLNRAIEVKSLEVFKIDILAAKLLKNFLNRDIDGGTVNFMVLINSFDHISRCFRIKKWPPEISKCRRKLQNTVFNPKTQ